MGYTLSFQREERQVRKYWTKAEWKIAWQTTNSTSPCLMSEHCRSPPPFSLVDCNALSSLGRFHIVSTAFCGICKAISLHFYRFMKWLFWVSIQKHPCHCQASAGLLSLQGWFYNPSLISLTLKLEPFGQNCQVLLLARELEHGPLIHIHFYQLSVFDGSLPYLSLAVLEFPLEVFLFLNSEIHLNLPSKSWI